VQTKKAGIARGPPKNRPSGVWAIEITNELVGIALCITTVSSRSPPASTGDDGRNQEWRRSWAPSTSTETIAVTVGSQRTPGWESGA